MSEVIVVDTDVLIDAGHGISEAVTCLEQVEQHAKLAISSITQMELIVGCRNCPFVGYPLCEQERTRLSLHRGIAFASISTTVLKFST